jgi:hypothetical protein
VGLLNNRHASELRKPWMAFEIMDASSPLPALLQQPPSTKRVGSLSIAKNALLLLPTRYFQGVNLLLGPWWASLFVEHATSANTAGA